MKRIVLVRARGPRNVGSVLRAVANFGPAELALVAPQRRSMLVHPDFVQMAHGVERVAERVRVCAELAEALADCTASYGFTARARDHRPLRDWREARAEIGRLAADPSERVALVFGSEVSGLSGQESSALEHLVRVPTSEDHVSLNLALAAGLVLSTLYLEAAPDAGARSSAPLSGAERTFLIERLKEVLGGLTTSASARRDLLASVERVFTRAHLETQDARAWMLLARAVGGKRSPAAYGLAELPCTRKRGATAAERAERKRRRSAETTPKRRRSMRAAREQRGESGR
jgi:tRNA/rRNA methyltransferase